MAPASTGEASSSCRSSAGRASVNHRVVDPEGVLDAVGVGVDELRRVGALRQARRGPLGQVLVGAEQLLEGGPGDERADAEPRLVRSLLRDGGERREPDDAQGQRRGRRTTGVGACRTAPATLSPRLDAEAIGGVDAEHHLVVVAHGLPLEHRRAALPTDRRDAETGDRPPVRRASGSSCSSRRP